MLYTHIYVYVYVYMYIHIHLILPSVLNIFFVFFMLFCFETGLE